MSVTKTGIYRLNNLYLTCHLQHIIDDAANRKVQFAKLSANQPSKTGDQSARGPATTSRPNTGNVAQSARPRPSTCPVLRTRSVRSRLSASKVSYQDRRAGAELRQAEVLRDTVNSARK